MLFDEIDLFKCLEQIPANFVIQVLSTNLSFHGPKQLYFANRCELNKITHQYHTHATKRCISALHDLTKRAMNILKHATTNHSDFIHDQYFAAFKRFAQPMQFCLVALKLCSFTMSIENSATECMMDNRPLCKVTCCYSGWSNKSHNIPTNCRRLAWISCATQLFPMPPPACRNIKGATNFADWS